MPGIQMEKVRMKPAQTKRPVTRLIWTVGRRYLTTKAGSRVVQVDCALITIDAVRLIDSRSGLPWTRHLPNYSLIRRVF